MIKPLLTAAPVVLAVVCWLADRPLGVDSAVYRAGALAVLRGQSLYEPLAAIPDWSPALPFTYPPIAAVLFLPLALVPAQLAWGVLAAGTVLALRTSVRLAGGPWWALPLLLCLEPVWRTIGLGQVNAVLMALVLLDVLALRGTRFGGVLIGVAAAVKLTPLVFVAHLLLTGRPRDAVRALAVFTGLGVAGLVLLPGDAVRYWTSTMLGANKASGNAWWGNQSLSGLVHRVTDGSPVVLALLALACLGVAAWLVRDLHRRGDAVGAVLVTAFAGLLVSPISWTHHWVWVVPLCAVLLARRRFGSAAAVMTLSAGWTFALVPRGEGEEQLWTPLESLAGNAYVLATGAAFGLLLLTRRVGASRQGSPVPS
ncbi:alpha-1,2-mannosyltransferase [Lentzea fradiae]|uniref:Alpha-1,2-mannosyltransferase n=1 Tax=Lentzea fradiae TaxID=200378 RepID=A0A1G7K838_9PSEU|nr:glycosyltransferase 87 family protein [Lentzea fradiae]SDF33220.1 alpha-1,2-mannosyltransferase [Lentzea fradiae]